MKYDNLYQEWLKAKHNKDYAKADAIRAEFEFEHGLTICAEGDMPIIGVTVLQVPIAKWEKKYGNPKLAEVFAAENSRFGIIFALGNYYQQARGY